MNQNSQSENFFNKKQNFNEINSFEDKNEPKMPNISSDHEFDIKIKKPSLKRIKKHRLLLNYRNPIEIELFPKFYQEYITFGDKKEILKNFQFIAKRTNRPLPGMIEKNNESYFLKYLYNNFGDFWE